MSEQWTADQIPAQRGRTAIVTGANSGLGLSTARELARHGAHVELALGNLASVEEFANGFRASHGEGGLDLLINNAGVMAPPRRETVDGFELQFGTNVLGHFALTGRLISLMEGREDARVVTLSSNAHKMGKINFDDLQSERSYRRWGAYGQSKLGDLMLALELDRRLRAAGSAIKSVAAHPGYAATNLQTAAAPPLDRIVMRFTNAIMAQSADMGALPTLYAATAPDVPGGSYIGPDGPGEFRGHPHVVTPSRAARDEQVAQRLWSVCEELTSVRFDLGAPAARQ